MKHTYYCFTILLLFTSSIGLSQQKKLDSIIQVTKSISDSLNINLAADLIYELNLNEKFEEGLKYCDSVIRISKEIKYDKGVGQIHNEKAAIYNHTDDLYEALKCFDQAALYYGRINYTRGLAIIQNNKAVIEQRLGNPEKSITHLLEANQYYEKLKDSASLSTTINNIGNVYGDINELESAKKYYYQSLALKRNTNSKTIGSTLNNLALIYIKEKKLDSALVLLNESLTINKRENDSHGIAEAYSALGRISFIKKEYQQAKKYYESALFIGGKVAYKERLIRTKLSLGEVAIKTKKFQDAESYISSATTESQKLNSTPLLLNCYDLSSTLDSAQGKYLDAYKWQKKYNNLFNAHTLKETSQKIELVKRRVEDEKKQQITLDKQKKSEQLAKEELFKQKIYTYLAIAAFVVAFIFIIGIVKSRLERAKYIKELNESNQVKNKLFSIVSHDLKNEIHGLDNTLNLLRDDVISENEFKEIIPLLSNSAHQTSLLLTNLLNWSKSQMNELKANPNTYDFSEIIREKIIFFSSKASQKEIKIINGLKNTTQVYADKDMCTIVTQNLIANAIKFCNPGDTITLFKKEEENVVKIYFNDTGIGISEENLKKIFSEETLTTKGTNNEAGTGLGLNICKELIALNQGTLTVESTLGKGSSFCITLPKNQNS
ncbi:tetratricopeptide repeat-containing sensor histidine kinase [uncultured Aquimarina sp.]|uniref:tetratricopeptide repeat-containing sensor histidine kinase n=1 Tax=uncultured Aquimarina sp. TaxID=575652 RepID=UPI00260C050B|nr:tetratricopeptide repeat-containing sensor histidine kinase [uncultured Aquimarina sp.]